MTAFGIPKDVQSSAQQIVERFNRANLRSSAAYVARFKGIYLYLDRTDYGSAPVAICRLKYTGSLNNWEFAIFKHRSNRYDPEEFMFPGAPISMARLKVRCGAVWRRILIETPPCGTT